MIKSLCMVPLVASAFVGLVFNNSPDTNPFSVSGGVEMTYYDEFEDELGLYWYVARFEFGDLYSNPAYISFEDSFYTRTSDCDVFTYVDGLTYCNLGFVLNVDTTFNLYIYDDLIGFLTYDEYARFGLNSLYFDEALDDYVFFDTDCYVRDFYLFVFDEISYATGLDYPNFQNVLWNYLKKDDISSSFFSSFTNAIGGTVSALGSGVSNAVSSLFIDDGKLSAFGFVCATFGGISVALGLCALGYRFVVTIGGKKHD